MNAVGLSDLRLVLPELILVVTVLVLLLLARRIKRALPAAAGTVFAALAAGAFAIWQSGGSPQTGFWGMYAVDGYSGFFKILILVALALVALMSARRVDEERIRPAEYHALLLLASTGMMFTVSAVDLLTLYLGLELTTLCAYCLVGITVEKPASNEAAIKYFLLGSFASALLLYGIALAYGVTGATNFDSIAAALTSAGAKGGTVLAVGIGLMAAGLGFKISAVPFHAWAPDAYQGAPVPVAAFLAAATKAVGLAAVARVCLVAFPSQVQMLSLVLGGLAALSIVFGSITALSQWDTRRLLAYSSISHAGYALLGLVSGTSVGASATMTYAFYYVFMTLGAFGVVIALGKRGETLDGFRGLAVQRPKTAAFMLLFLLSLTGIPPTAGFVAKFVVILDVVREGYWELAILAVVCSVISAFFYLRIAVHMYMREPRQAEPSPYPWAVSAALAVAALVTVLGGVFPGGLTLWAVAP